jgi:serine/threonine-protein kinase
MGTPPYMSPEQCRGITEEIDHRTDVYALGIIVYEMLTGAPPFMSAGWGDVVLMHVTKPVPPPRGKNPDIPAELEVVILKALAKLSDDRWPSMADMDAALRKSIGAPPKGFVSGFDTPGGATTGAVTGSGRITTLGASSGEVAPDDGEVAKGPRPLWRRTPVLFGGSVVVATAIAAITLGGRRTPTASSEANGAAALAAPSAAPVVQAPPSPPRVVPAVAAPSPATPPPVALPAKPAAAEPATAPTATEDNPERRTAHVHKHEHEPHAAKKTASAAPPPPAAPTPPPAAATSAPARPRPVEKW